MKTLLLAGFTTLALSTIAPIAKTEPAATALNPYKAEVSTSAAALTPAELVGLASHGYLKQQGIPSSGALVSQYQFGTISAGDLANAAVAENRLSPQLALERGYLEAVNNQLQIISNNR